MPTNTSEKLKTVQNNNKMKKVIIIALALLLGVATNPLFAQKKATEVVCFKSNMDCANCQKALTNYLKFEKGVKDLKVDLVTNTIMVEYKAGKNSKEGFAKAIEKKGYVAEEITSEEYEKIMAPHKGHDHNNGQEH